jgi:hypothetical protein
MAEIMIMKLKGKLSGNTNFSLVMRESFWWAVLDSNQRHPVCKAGTQKKLSM